MFNHGWNRHKLRVQLASFLVLIDPGRKSRFENIETGSIQKQKLLFELY